MSINITVNGPLTKRCGNGSILNETERKRKELEGARRILRLQQVRAESKTIAAKIRQDVAAEKERQLYRLEQVKAQELNCWRECMLTQENHDYRSAIFQVGTAHHAAKVERELLAAAKQQKSERETIKTRKEMPSKVSRIKKSSIKKTVASQTEPPIAKKRKKRKTPMKHKRSVKCSHEQSCCHCPKDFSIRIENTTASDSSTSSLFSSTLSVNSSCLSDLNEEDGNTKSSHNATLGKLSQTPAVLLEVDVNSSDSIIITAPDEMKDRHVENNRQFTRVIKKNLDKLTKNKPHAQAPIANDSAPIAVKSDQSSTSTKKRFTQISELLQKKMFCHEGQKSMEDNEVVVPHVPHNTPRVSSPKSKSMSPRSKPTSPRKSPRKSEKSVASTVTINTKSSSTMDPKSGSTCGSRVQFYDYHNKFAKEYEQPDFVTRQTPARSNAMEQALIEKDLHKAKLQEQEKLRQKTEERGQKAFEREQIRRDCLDLTEKLEILTNEHPHLIPNDTHLYYSSNLQSARAARKEVKMNSAIEEILMRPAIITCPEIKTRNVDNCERDAGASTTLEDAINVARHAEHDQNALSSESCCSILLGYVNDQSKQIRDDINTYQVHPNNGQDKVKKLKELLARIEQLRQILLAELAGEKSDLIGNVDEVIDSISTLRKERENILVDGNEGAHILLKNREKELNQKEAILEKRIREFYNLQKGKEEHAHAPKTSEKHKASVQTKGERPVEIIICVNDHKKKLPRGRSPRKVSTLIQSPTPKKITKRKKVETKATNTTQRTQDEIGKQFTIDSNSTSYISLPSSLHNNIDEITERIATINDDRTAHQTERQSTDETDDKKHPPLNPLVAHYVQRLLGMSKHAIIGMNVSESTMETPSSSVINASANIVSAQENVQISEDHMERMQQFIADNYSLINELEQTIRSQGQVSFERTMRSFEEMWMQRLHRNEPSEHTQSHRSASKKKTRTTAVILEQHKKDKEKSNIKENKQSNQNKPKIIEDRSKTNSKDQNIAGQKTVKNRSAITTAAQPKTPVSTKTRKLRDKSTETQKVHYDAEAQMLRYAKLTENCAHRINELTDLISRVRGEKQRLLEKTLSSSSENDRNLTVYLDMPGAENAVKNEKKVQQPGHADLLPPENQPLEKDKQIGISRDSGICMSRPVTAQGQHPDIDPTSFASSNTSSTSHRKSKPPPTLRRFSPQLVNEEYAHELSTIAEVDTPATSRINAAITSAPQGFLTFEQYAQKFNLDFSHLDLENSALLQKEISTLIAALKEGNLSVNYEEFPSLTAYLQNVTSTEQTIDISQLTTENTLENLEKILSCLRLKDTAINPFPTQKEYMKCMKVNAADLIDTESLENLTDDSDTLNIEEELKRRKLLKQSFRTMSGKNRKQFTSQTDESFERTQKNSNESGIEKLSTSSTLSASLERDFFRLGMKITSTNKKNAKDAITLSSNSSTSLDKHSLGKQTNKQQQKKNDASESQNGNSQNEGGKPMNLREFITRELLKHVESSSSSSLHSDDSLRSQFIHSIIDSLSPSETPQTNAVGSAVTNSNLERHKTSTPVYTRSSETRPHGSSSTRGTMSGHLFSGESRLSSVYFQETTPTSSGLNNSKNNDTKDGKTQNKS